MNRGPVGVRSGVPPCRGGDAFGVGEVPDGAVRVVTASAPANLLSVPRLCGLVADGAGAAFSSSSRNRQLCYSRAPHRCHKKITRALGVMCEYPFVNRGARRPLFVTVTIQLMAVAGESRPGCGIDGSIRSEPGTTGPHRGRSWIY